MNYEAKKAAKAATAAATAAAAAAQNGDDGDHHDDEPDEQPPAPQRSKRAAKKASRPGKRQSTKKFSQLKSKSAKDGRVQESIKRDAEVSQEWPPSAEFMQAKAMAQGATWMSKEANKELQKKIPRSAREEDIENKVLKNRVGSRRRREARRLDWAENHPPVSSLPANLLPPGCKEGMGVYCDFESALKCICDVKATPEWFTGGMTDLHVVGCHDGATGGIRAKVGLQLGTIKILNDTASTCSSMSCYPISAVICGETKSALLPIQTFLAENMALCTEIEVLGEMRRVIYHQNQDEKGFHISKCLCGNGGRLSCHLCDQHGPTKTTAGHYDKFWHNPADREYCGKLRRLDNVGCDHRSGENGCTCALTLAENARKEFEPAVGATGNAALPAWDSKRRGHKKIAQRANGSLEAGHYNPVSVAPRRQTSASLSTLPNYMLAVCQSIYVIYSNRVFTVSHLW
jgi:hypothetical protein